MKNFTKADGLGADVILRLLYDGKHNGIWISAGKGLFYMDLECGGEIRGIFDIKHGPRGRLMLIADTGIHLADKRNEARPKLAVNKITVDGKVHENPARLDIPSGARRLTSAKR